jgi:hypothetical protein
MRHHFLWVGLWVGEFYRLVVRFLRGFPPQRFWKVSESAAGIVIAVHGFCQGQRDLGDSFSHQGFRWEQSRRSGKKRPNSLR